jgi:predicted Zn-ribbon and HTH transcriptional regulator
MRNEKTERNNLIALAKRHGATEIEISYAAGISKQAVSEILNRPIKASSRQGLVYPKVPCRRCGYPRNKRKVSIQQCSNCFDGTYTYQ